MQNNHNKKNISDGQTQQSNINSLYAPTHTPTYRPLHLDV